VEQAASGITAWSDGAQFMVQWQLEGNNALQVDVLDATGKIVLQRQARNANGRLVLDGAQLPSGIYFLRVTAGDQQRTFRLPLVR